jgi:hypothetical protein
LRENNVLFYENRFKGNLKFTSKIISVLKSADLVSKFWNIIILNYTIYILEAIMLIYAQSLHYNSHCIECYGVLIHFLF